jgi:hypothetical protein
MFRSLTGTIGAVLLGGAALFAPPQEQTPTKPADYRSVDEQACYHWVRSLTGIDPQAHATAAAQPEQHASFKKALSTCLQGRRSTG